MWRDAALVAAKDLRIEARSRVGVQQVGPFALVVLVLFALAFDADHDLLRHTAAGLFWVVVLFAAVLLVQRSFGVETQGARDGLRLAALDPAGVFLGKAAAVAAQLLALEVVLGIGVAVLYSTSLRDGLLLVSSAALATVGLAAAGTVYGLVATAVGVPAALLPLLLLPVVSPVLLAAARCWEAALGFGGPGAGWLRILIVFAVVYLAVGVIAFGPLLEEC